MNHTRLVLVADNGEAKVYRSDPAYADLELLQAWHNPAGRLTRGEQDADRPGVQRSGRGGYHGLGGDDDSQRNAGGEFARTLCGYLHDAHLTGGFDSLVLVAPPHFLGELRAHLHKDCAQMLDKTLNKDLVRADIAGLRAALT